MRWLVDGMNVIGSRPDGWWRDRRAAMLRLCDLLVAFAVEVEEPLTVFFDSRPFDLSAAPIDVVFPPEPGRDAADHEIVAYVEADPDPDTITVITSDRELAGRVRATRAHVLPSGAFRRRLDGLGA